VSPSSRLLLLAKTITHAAARSLCDSWASCFTCKSRFIEPVSLPMQVLLCGNVDFRRFCCSCDLDFGPMTFVYELDHINWRYTVFSRDVPDVRKWTSYVKAFQSYCLTDRQTDRTEIIYYTPPRGQRVINKVTTAETHTWRAVLENLKSLQWQLERCIPQSSRGLPLIDNWNFCQNENQHAQLSQTDRAAGWVIVFAKSRRLELRDNILRTL